MLVRGSANVCYIYMYWNWFPFQCRFCLTATHKSVQKNLNSVKETSQCKKMDVSNTLMQIQKHWTLYKGWPGDADTETLNTVQRMARWCGYRNSVHCIKDGQVMWIQKHWTLYKEWPGDVDTETMNTIQRMARWCRYRNTQHCTKDSQVMWIQKHCTKDGRVMGIQKLCALYKGWPGDAYTETLCKGWPGDADTETLNTGLFMVQRTAGWCEYRNTVQILARWCGYRNTEHCTKDGQVMWIQKHWTLHKGWPGDVDTETLYKGWPGDVDTETLNTAQRMTRWCGYRNTVQRMTRWCGYRNTVQRMARWRGYRNTVQRMTRWCGYRNTAHCTMNGQETKKAEKRPANWSRKRQDSLLDRVSDHEDKHNTDKVFNSPLRQGFFSHSQLSVQTLLWCLYSPCVQLHQHLCTDQNSQSSTSIPLTGHTKILHTLIGLGSVVPRVSVAMPS